MDDLYTNTKIGETIARFRHHLGVSLYQGTINVHATARIESIIPKPERRRVWQELKHRGWRLPDLELPGPMRLPFLFAFLTAILSILTHVWTLLITLVEGTYWYWKLTRPLAVHAPRGYETVEQLALQTTKFGIDDYRRGLWPREVLAAKIRSILAVQVGVPFDEIKNDTKLDELLGC
jgi:hypothetical protein